MIGDWANAFLIRREKKDPINWGMGSYKLSKRSQLGDTNIKTTMKYITLIFSAIVLANTVYAAKPADGFRIALDRGHIKAPDAETIWPLAANVSKTVPSGQGRESFEEAWKSARYLAFCSYYDVDHSNAQLTEACEIHRDDLARYGEKEIGKAMDAFEEHGYHGALNKKALFELKYLQNLFSVDLDGDFKKEILKCKSDDDADKLTHCVIQAGIERWYVESKDEDALIELINDAK